MSKFLEILEIVYVTFWCAINLIVGMCMCIADILGMNIAHYWLNIFYEYINEYVDTFSDE